MRVYLTRQKRVAIERAALEFEASARRLRTKGFPADGREHDELARTLRSILTDPEDGAGG